MPFCGYRTMQTNRLNSEWLPGHQSRPFHCLSVTMKSKIGFFSAIYSPIGCYGNQMQYRCRTAQHITRCPNIAQLWTENPTFAYLQVETMKKKKMKMKIAIYCYLRAVEIYSPHKLHPMASLDKPPTDRPRPAMQPNSLQHFVNYVRV